MRELNLDHDAGVLEQEFEDLDAQLYDADDLHGLRTEEEPSYLRKPSRTRMKRSWRERCK